MKHVFASLISALAIAGFALGATGCAQFPSTSEALDTLSTTPAVSSGATMEPGVLTVGLNAANAPYSYSTGATDTGGMVLEGFEIDVAIARASEMDMSVKFVNVGTNDEAASNGACDIVLGVSDQTDLNGRESIVRTYAESAPAIFAKGASSVTAEQLASATIGVKENSVSAYVLQSMIPDVDLRMIDTLNNAFSELDAGNVTYVACDSFLGGYLANTFEGITLVGALSLPDSRGIAVPVSNSELSTAVSNAFDALVSRGDLDKITTSWVGNLTPINASIQVIVQQPEAEDEFAEGEGYEEGQNY